MPNTKKVDVQDPVDTLRAENETLRKEVSQIRGLMAQMAQHMKAQGFIAPEKVLDEVPLEEQPWYIKPGSERHAQLLGLEPDPDSATSWKLADPTLWGPVANKEFLVIVLQQKINELGSGAPDIQSVSPLMPNFAIPMWVPIETEA